MLVTCVICQKEFNKFPKDIKRNKTHYCSVKCYETTRQRIPTECTECQKPLLKTKSEMSEGDNHFCGSRCSALYNNRNKKIGKKKTKKCKVCDNLVFSHYTYCSVCISEKKHINGEALDPNKTLGYYKSRCKDMNKYRYIRENAKKVASVWERKCMYCEYSKHVETCHVRDISDFPDTALMGEINNPNNLLLLCRNCHWEFDHDLLPIEEIRKLGHLGYDPRT